MRSRIKKRNIVAWIICIALGAFIVRGLLVGLRFMRTTGLTPTLAAQLVFNDGVRLKSASGRTNILLLGIGGGGHEGADLTDTMMVVSLSGKGAAFISVPRDIWSDTLKDRVNSAYHYGEEKSREAGSRSAGKQGGGLLLAKVIAEDVVGIPIHYAILVDFSGFKEIIDLVGGIEVNVAAAFTDNDYPIAGKEKETCPGDPTNRCVYETVHFDAGRQRMDGESALKYVRSRNAQGDEGSDFARSRRQQEVIVALKDALVHPTGWFSVGRVNQLIGVVDRATDTDMNLGELATVAKRIAGVDNARIQKVSFEDLLYTPPSYMYGRYVLIPQEDWDTIHAFMREQLGLPQ